MVTAQVENTAQPAAYSGASCFLTADIDDEAEEGVVLCLILWDAHKFAAE